jgi:hypothetical protein
MNAQCWGVGPNSSRADDMHANTLACSVGGWELSGGVVCWLQKLAPQTKAPSLDCHSLGGLMRLQLRLITRADTPRLGRLGGHEELGGLL